MLYIYGYKCHCSDNLIIAYKSFESIAVFKYLGMTITNQKCIHEEIKSRSNSGNACYHSVQNVLSSHLLSKKLKIKIYRTIILPVLLYVYDSWSHSKCRTDTDHV